MLDKQNNFKKWNGFSLIELLIVIAIIGIISSIAIPSYMDSVTKTRRNDARETLLRLVVAQENFYSQNGQYTTEISGVSGLNNGSNNSAEGYYSITSTLTGTNVFTLTAKAITGKAQHKDTDCREFSIDSTNMRLAKTAAGVNSVDCW